MRQVYDRILDQVIGRYGNQQTSDSQLRSMLDHYRLTPYEVGSKTTFLERTDPDGDDIRYGIYNTDHTPPGTHWFCTYDGYVYDPLGDDDSRTQEQPDDTDDCGQRCIAYLLMCKRLKRGSIRF